MVCSLLFLAFDFGFTLKDIVLHVGFGNICFYRTHSTGISRTKRKAMALKICVHLVAQRQTYPNLCLARLELLSA